MQDEQVQHLIERYGVPLIVDLNNPKFFEEIEKLSSNFRDNKWVMKLNTEIDRALQGLKDLKERVKKRYYEADKILKIKYFSIAFETSVTPSGRQMLRLRNLEEIKDPGVKEIVKNYQAASSTWKKINVLIDYLEALKELGPKLNNLETLKESLNTLTTG